MCHNQETYRILIEEVGQWSHRNFGLNQSKWPFGAPKESPPCHIVLDHTACVLGIVEELGELSDAFHRDDPTEIRDAIGDVQIYLADYLFRLGYAADLIDWHDLGTQRILANIDYQLPKLIGRFAHINLKRHQGIRGWSDDAKFLPALRECLTEIMLYLREIYIISHPKDRTQLNAGWELQDAADAIMAIAASTWQSVKQRNWVASPQTGG